MLCAQALPGCIYLASRRDSAMSRRILELCHVKLFSAGIGLAARSRRQADLSSTIRLIKFGGRVVAHAGILDRAEPAAQAARRTGRAKRLPSQGHRRVPGGGKARSGKAVLAMTERSMGNITV